MTHPSRDDEHGFPILANKRNEINILAAAEGKKLHCRNLIEKIGFIALAEESDVVMDYL